MSLESIFAYLWLSRSRTNKNP